MEPDASRGRVLDSSQQIIKSFIAEYKSSPELWDPKDHNYTNKYRRAEAQDRLLTILKRIQNDATRLDVRKKINTFRSNYNKKAGMVRAAEAEGREYIPKSWLYHELRFLDTIKKSDSQTELIENESEEGGECIEEIAEDIMNEIKIEVPYPTAINYVEIGDNQETFEEDQQNGLMEPVDKKPKLVNHIIVDGTGVVSQHRKSKIKPGIRRSDANTQRVNSSTTSVTTIEPIALVWSSKLQVLQPTQRLYAEKAINDILFEASLNNLQKGPMVINAGVSSVSYAETEGFPIEVQEEYIEYVSTDEGEVS